MRPITGVCHMAGMKTVNRLNNPDAGSPWLGRKTTKRLVPHSSSSSAPNIHSVSMLKSRCIGRRIMEEQVRDKPPHLEMAKTFRSGMRANHPKTAAPMPEHDLDHPTPATVATIRARMPLGNPGAPMPIICLAFFPRRRATHWGTKVLTSPPSLEICFTIDELR